MKTEIIKVTPEMAKELLKFNTNNRNLNKDRVLFYAAQMKAGEWVLSNDAIAISKDGKILNGQHRLNAVINSGQIVDFLLIYGLDESVMPMIDTGKSRSAGDVLKIKNIPNANTVAGMIKRYYTLTKKRYEITSANNLKLSNNKTLKIYNQDPGFWQKLARDVYKNYQKLKIIPPAQQGGYIAYYTKNLSFQYDEILTFFENVSGKKDTNANAPKLLRELIVNSIVQNNKFTAAVIGKLIMYSLDKYLQGDEIKLIAVNHALKYKSVFSPIANGFDIQ